MFFFFSFEAGSHEMYALQESNHERLADLAQVAEEEEGYSSVGGDRCGDEDEFLEPVMFATSPGGGSSHGGGDHQHQHQGGSGAVVNFNVDSLKGMLKCVGCQRFLFPPILQCIAGKILS